MKEGLAYVDGKVMDLGKAMVPLHDRGYLLGDGVFETLRSSNGHLFRLDDHAARMRRGLRAIGLDESLEAEYREAVQQLFEKGGKAFGGDLYIRVMVTTGPMGDILGTDRGLSITGLCKKFKPYPMQYYSNGVQVILSTVRKDSRDPLCGVKTLSFLPYITARRQAHSQTAHDAILLNERDRVAEGSTSNVFAFVGGTVHAPGEPEGAIDGVTRKAVLELVEEIGLPVKQRLELAELRAADEVWLSNTTGGIVPVTRFQDKPIGDGRKGELTTRLMRSLETEIRGHHEPPATATA